MAGAVLKSKNKSVSDHIGELNPQGMKVEPSERKANWNLCLDDLKQLKIVVVIPAYNEERFIGSVVLKARRFTDIVIVVDDGSLDRTSLVAKSGGAIVIEHSENLGKAAALTTAFQEARTHNPDVVVMLDGDGQHMPEEIAQVVTPIIKYQADIVVGSRYLENTSNVPRHRTWGHWIFNILTRLSSGVAVSDSQSGYRAFSPQALNLVYFRSNGFAVESEMQFLAHEHELKLVEVPITIQYLDKPKRPVMQQGFSVLNGMMRLTGQYRPLLFFGVPGLGLLLSGVAWGLVVVNCFTRTHQLAIGYTLICVLLSVFGLIMMSTGFILHSIRGLLCDMLRGYKNN
jgi:glycosyltransferase involved in cell wall biosynthesis